MLPPPRFTVSFLDNNALEKGPVGEFTVTDDSKGEAIEHATELFLVLFPGADMNDYEVVCRDAEESLL